MARASAIACGYEDAIDLDRLRHDPLMKVAVGRCPASGAPLASQSTISRLENAPSKTEAARLCAALLDQFGTSACDQAPAPPLAEDPHRVARRQPLRPGRGDEWAEDHHADYIFGLAGNAALDALVAEAAVNLRFHHAMSSEPKLRTYASGSHVVSQCDRQSGAARPPHRSVLADAWCARRDPPGKPACEVRVRDHPRALDQDRRARDRACRIRIQLPTSCPHAALFRCVALGLMLSGP